MSCHLQLTNHSIFFGGYPSIIGFCFGVVVIPLIFPKVPQSSLGIPRGFPTVRNTPSPWTPPGPFKNPTNLCEICRLTTTFLAPWPSLIRFHGWTVEVGVTVPTFTCSYGSSATVTFAGLLYLSVLRQIGKVEGEREDVGGKTHTCTMNKATNEENTTKWLCFFFFLGGKFENNGGSILKRGNSKLPSC